MHWDGTHWRRIESPNLGAAGVNNELHAVTATSATDVWAVGTACEVDPAVPCHPLALHLSGGAWQIVPTAGVSGTHLKAVVARSRNDVWAIGYDQRGPETNHVEHWDGRRFTKVPAGPGIPGSTVNEVPASALTGAAMDPTSRALWAVGWTNNDTQVIRHD
jgi:hypothetical protein